MADTFDIIKNAHTMMKVAKANAREMLKAANAKAFNARVEAADTLNNKYMMNVHNANIAAADAAVQIAQEVLRNLPFQKRQFNAEIAVLMQMYDEQLSELTQQHRGDVSDLNQKMATHAQNYKMRLTAAAHHLTSLIESLLQ